MKEFADFLLGNFYYQNGFQCLIRSYDISLNRFTITYKDEETKLYMVDLIRGLGSKDNEELYNKFKDRFAEYYI